MKKRKFEISKKIILPTISVCLLLMGIGVFTSLHYNFKNNSINEEKNDGNIVSLRLVSTITNDDGSVTQTFKYDISPENASDKSVMVSAQYIDGSDCSDVVTVTSDTANTQISVTVKKDFDQKIKVFVTSNSNNSLTREVVLDYEKKLLSLNNSSNNIQIGGLTKSYADPEVYVDEWTYENEVEFMFAQDYSKYTVDKEYTYNITYASHSYDEILTANGTQSEWIDALGNYLLDVLSNNATVNKTEIWNLIDSNDYHSWLVSTAEIDGASIGYDIYFTVTCNEDSTKTLDGYTYIYIGLDHDYSSFSVLVDDLTLTESSLLF